MNLAQLLARSAQVFPAARAVAVGAKTLYDYRELARRAACIAGALTAEYGLRAGDRVALYLDNCAPYLEALYGIWWAGLVAVPINAKLHEREAAYILESSESRVCFVDAAHALGDVLGFGARLVDIASTAYAKLIEGPPRDLVQTEPDTLAWLFYTSGTTGRPKGAMLSHRNLMTMTAGYFTDVDDVQPSDSIIYAAPMSHGAGMYNLPHVLRAAQHVIPESGGFDPAEIVALAATWGSCSMFAAPTMVQRLVQHAATTQIEPAGLKTVIYGGGPMYVEDAKRALEVMGNRFVQIYGQGESPMTISVLARGHLSDRQHPRWEQRIASVGVTHSLVEVAVVDADGHPLPSGVVGEIMVRGDTVMLGYWQDPQATAKSLRQGWLWTGDMGAMDNDGFLTLKDRSKDVIISGGSNIYPREVEEVLLKHPAVREVSVIGRPDPEWGEVVVAYVVAAQDVAAAELDQQCLQNIARFKRPKVYRFVPSLPKNNYGKVLKSELRELERSVGAKGV